MAQRFVLRGLDGANPLGFLAAAGLTRLLRGARLGWEIVDAVWRPVLWTDAEDEEALCERVAGVRAGRTLGLLAMCLQLVHVSHPVLPQPVMGPAPVTHATHLAAPWPPGLPGPSP